MPIDPNVNPLFDQYATQHNVDPDVLRAMHLVETGGTGRWDQTSPRGARGGMQFMPETAAQYGVEDPTKPEFAIPGAARYLSDLLDRYEKDLGSGSQALGLALRDYSGGAQGYANKVAQYYATLRPPKGQAENDEIRGSANFAKRSGMLGDPNEPGWAERNLATVPAPGGVAFQVHRQAAPSFQGFLNDLAATGYRIDAGGGHDNRNIRGGTQLSEHAFGNAIDINPERNPMGPDLVTDLPQNVAELAAKHGLSWGGDWQSRKDAMHFEWAGPRGKKQMSGLEELAAAGQPQAAPAQNPGIMQLAQAGQSGDQQLMQQFINGDFDHLFKPPAAAAPQPSQAQPPSAPNGQSGALPPSPGAPIVQYADPGTAMYHPNLKQQLMTFPDGQALLKNIQDMEKDGFQLNRDGTQSIIKGGKADPMVQYQGQRSESLGKNLLTVDQGGTAQNSSGVSESAADKAGKEQRAKSENTIYEQRPGAQPVTGKQVFDAANPTGDPGTVPGRSALYSNPGIGKGEDIAAEQFGKHREAYVSNLGSIQNLNNFLEAAATTGTGKGTELSGNAAAWLKSIGVDPQKLALADPAEVEKMRKASTQMIFQQIKSVTSRPAYQEFQMLAQGNPNPDLQPEANRAIAAALLGRMNWENALYKAWDADRRSPEAGGSYGHFDFPGWAEANQPPAFQAHAYEGVPAIPDRGVVGKGEAAPFRDGQIATNPQTGEKLIFRSGQWVPFKK